MKLKKKKNNQKNHKNQNLVAKIMSLVIAVLLWSYVMTIENPDERRVIRNVRVKFLNADLLRDSDNQLMTQEDQFVNITLRGKKNELEKVRADMINASVDLEGYGAGNTRIPIDVNLEGVSSLVSVDTISPPSIIVNIDKIVSRDFEVQVDTKGNPKENYMKGDNQLSSPKVQVTGAASQIGIIDSIRTNIDVDGKEKGFTVTNPLYAVDANGNRLSNVSIKP
ncbi:MAG: YbbR-like domain-containing protein, partial [Ezakiella massiliensis]